MMDARYTRSIEQPKLTAIVRGTGVTVRAVVLAGVLVFLVNFAIGRMELVAGGNFSGGIPPIPATLALTLLSLSTPLLARLSRRLALSPREMLVVFCLMLAALPFSAIYGIRAFMPRLTVLQYFASPENHFSDYIQFIPRWWAPTDQQAIIDMYEGTEVGRVPWRHWAEPLGWWILFFTVLYFTMMCMTTLLRKQWQDHERLVYPLVELPMELVGSAEVSGAAVFFKNPLAYIGLAAALIYNALNIGHALNPAIPSIGTYQFILLDNLLTERPWTALRPLYLATHPMYIGFGWLASQEMAFSIFFFTFAVKFINLGGALVGYQPTGFPFFKEHATGGYLAMTVVTLWVARGHLKQAWQKATAGLRGVDDSEEAMPFAIAFTGLAAGSAFFLAWCAAGGMSLKLALPFWLLILSFALVYARIRAEAGVPFEFTYPWQMVQYSMIYALGGKGLLQLDKPRGIVVWNIMSFLSRFHHAQTMTAYQVDTYKIAQRAAIRLQSLAPVLLLFAFLGLVFGFWMHLANYYEFGLNTLEGNAANIDWRTSDTVSAYTQMVSMLEHPAGPDLQRTGWIIGGAVATGAMWIIRNIWLRFPLHPLGYIVATAYGVSTHLWFPFLFIWVIKGIVLRVAGVRGFRRLVPTFVAFAFGHFIFGGVVWSVMRLFYSTAVIQRYWVIF